jgi:hypothetical protein
MSSGPCILESFLGSAIWGRRQREQANLSVKSPAMGRWSFPDILHHRAAATNDCLWHRADHPGYRAHRSLLGGKRTKWRCDLST